MYSYKFVLLSFPPPFLQRNWGVHLSCVTIMNKIGNVPVMKNSVGSETHAINRPFRVAMFVADGDRKATVVGPD